jgi:hypothetical protein
MKATLATSREVKECKEFFSISAFSGGLKTRLSMIAE